MLALAIILIILGVIVFRWYSRGVSEPFYNRALIFSRPVPVLVINLIWMSLLGGGLYCFWQVNPKIVFYIIGGYALLWLVGFMLGSQKQKAKKYFQIYKQLKIYQPNTKEHEILKETTKLYYKNLHWDDEKINGIIEVLFDQKDSKYKDVKDSASMVFAMEESDDGFDPSCSNFRRRMKKTDKRRMAIEQAYDKVFKKSEKINQRPTLSEDSIARLKKTGLDPNTMSNEQLSALESIDNPEKSNWLAKLFRGTGLFSGFFAFMGLLAFDVGTVLFYSFFAFLLTYIGYRIQVRIANKKFMEASIIKWSEEQKNK